MAHRLIMIFSLTLMGVLLVLGCFGVYLCRMESTGTGGIRLPVEEKVFSKFSISTELTPGENTVTVETGWYVRKRVGLFVLGGMYHLLLDTVTITTPSTLMPGQKPRRLVDLLPKSAPFSSMNLAEVRRLEFRTTKDKGSESFLRVAVVEIPVGHSERINLDDAWFRADGHPWEPLQQAWIERANEENQATLHLFRQTGVHLSMPLGISL